MPGAGTFSRLLDYPWHFVPIVLLFMLRGHFLNPELFIVEQVLLYTLIAVVVTIGLFLLLRRFLKLHLAGIVISLYALLFFTYGLVYEVTGIIAQMNYSLPRAVLVYMPHAFVGLAILTTVLMRFQKREFPRLTTFLNTAALTMVIIALQSGIGTLVAGELQRGTITNTALENIQLPAAPPEKLPDVYYIILDGYPRADYLQNHFGIDNSAFVSALEQAGFYVADQSLSNYTYTIASLGSSLNLDYIQNLVTPDLYSSAVTSFLVDSRAALTFQQMGYTYVVITSGYLPYSTIADLTIDVDANRNLVYLQSGQDRPDLRRDYLQYLYRTTLLRLLDPTLALLPGEINSWMGPDRVEPQLQALAQISTMPEPTFTFFHLTKPHPPIVLDQDGNRFFWTDHYETQAEYLQYEEIHFADTLTYLNRRVLQVIDEILRNSAEPPIIVLQGDHGIQLQRFEVLAQKGNSPIAILNAYYFPDQDYQALREDIRPINSLRLIFNQYFGIEYELLPEISYFQPFAAFASVTRRLQFEPIGAGQIEAPYSSMDADS